MKLRTLVSKLREAKIVSGLTPIEVFTTKENGKLDYEGTCIEIDSSNIREYLIRQCEVEDFSVNIIGKIVKLTVRISAYDYREALNDLMKSYLYKAYHGKDDTFNTFERQYDKLRMIGMDRMLDD